MGLKNTDVFHRSPRQFCIFAARNAITEDYPDIRGFHRRVKRKLSISGWERIKEAVSMVSAAGNVAVAAEIPNLSLLVELQI